MVRVPALISSILSWGLAPSTVQPTDWHVPRISFTVPESFLASERCFIFLAIPMIWSIVRFPLCLTKGLEGTRTIKDT